MAKRRGLMVRDGQMGNNRGTVARMKLKKGDGVEVESMP